MGIGIRKITAVLFALLLIVTGAFITIVNYSTGKNLLFQFTVNFVKSSETTIEHQLVNYLSTAKDSLNFGGVLIQQKIINSTDSEALTQFLRRLLGENKIFSGMHWTDAQSNFNLVERSANNTYVNEIRSCKNNVCHTITKILDKNGKMLSQAPDLSGYDPRTRPWYKKAMQVKDAALTDVFLMYPFGPNKSAPGITAVKPIFSLEDPTKLLGVLSIDIKLDALADFLAYITITPNTIIFLFDENNNFIAGKVLDVSGTAQTPAMQPNLSWATDSFKRYQISKLPSFFYTHENVQYIAFYSSIKKIFGVPWNIEIVLPVNDIVGEWNKNLIFTTLIATLILGCGILFVWFLSTYLSRPIKRMSDEATAIKQLEFANVAPLKTLITEIRNMQDAFSAMKQSLQSFSRYVSFSLVKKLMSSGTLAQVGGENKELTFLFSDINGFTTISENMDPQKLMNFLSEYFESMTRIVLEKKGNIDKYIGDGIMAFWGAPLDDDKHALHACEAAVLMQAALVSLNNSWKAKNYPQISVRMGIHTGATVVGNVGSEEKLSYTALGDNVNLCSRLQDLNKLYNTKILVSSTTYELTKDTFKYRLLDHVAVRGKHNDVFVYELLPANHFLLEQLDQYNIDFKNAFYAYQQGNWQQAISSFEQLKGIYPQDGLIDIYLDRCYNFIKQSPKDWNGVWRL